MVQNLAWPVAFVASIVKAAPQAERLNDANQRPWVIGQSVKTSSGTLLGHPAKDKQNVSEYLGIPYVKPPVGDRRWAAPQKFFSKGNFNASAYSRDCPATFQSPALAVELENPNPSGIPVLAELVQLGHEVSEDCLTINVWTKPQVEEKTKAVLFWIYGGGFATGNSANRLYDGQYLADSQDVIVVSFNYRVSIFGFPGIDAIPAGVAKNAGLLDQRMALEWTRDNIAGFGGDPNRIVMFGESAGAASVDLYSYTYPDDPIVSGTIAQSGSATSFTNPHPANNLEHWNKAAKALKCPVTPITESVKCMRAEPMRNILEAVRVDNALQAVLGFFGPSVDQETVFDNYEERGQQGRFINKPHMAGSNDNEAGLFKLIGAAAKIKIASTVWSVFNDAVFTCPVAKAAGYRAALKLPTWRYRYFGDWPNTNLQPGSGAYHTAEVPMIFGTTATVTAQANIPPQQRVSDFMMQTWAAFAKDPMSISRPPFNLPIYDPETASTEKTLIGFGANGLTRQLLSPINYDSNCAAIDKMLKSIPGGVFGAITNIATGKDMVDPGLKGSELPNPISVSLPPAPAGAV